MAPIKTPNKRIGESIDADDVTTPKKEKKTPAKKTPKVVQLGTGTPKSVLALKSPVTSPAGTPVTKKTAPKKTPLKLKTPSAVTPANTETPKGKMSEPSPLMTRSARKKKAALNSAIGTPVVKNASPSKPVSTKKTPVTTPKSGGRGKAKKREEEDEEDLKLQLDSDDDEEMDSEDSDDLASDQDHDTEDESGGNYYLVCS